mgnify:CR=1 FL=1
MPQLLIPKKQRLRQLLRYMEFEYVFICMPKFKHNPNGLPLTETIQLLPTDIEDKINDNIDLNPQWPTSGLIAIQFLLNNYNKIFIFLFNKYEKTFN